ncbi:MAG TPA: alpha/beta fold hydrolase [Acidimicrobiales bacterium]|nr:alpha/beta fold hydrolase [Acidimicrobiales bacterium]
MGSGGRRLLFIAVCAAAAMPFVPLAHASTYTDQSPPGANDWSCKPTTAHPRPLVLVHGLGATAAENWNYLSPILEADGYCVYALTYGVDSRYPYMGGVIAMEQSSHELDAFVHRVLTATGAAQVDLVGHSEGTVMPQYWLWKLGGAPLVHEYVALTPLYDGTTFNGIASLESYDQGGAFAQFASGYCGSCLEFIKGSPFLTDLYRNGVAAPGVHYTTIMTTHDELVTPYTSGNLDSPQATNIVIQNVCPNDLSEHGALAFDPVAARLVQNALDPSTAVAPTCGQTGIVFAELVL